jgi:hypothetical protein
MADAAGPGMFWCDECRSEFPDVLRTRHIASHDAQHIDPPTRSTNAIFMVLCVVEAVIIVLLVSAPR